MISKLRTFAAMSRAHQGAALEAIFMLAFARAWLLLVPFKSVAQHIGTPSHDKTLAVGLLPESQLPAARMVRWSIALAAARVPFKAVCLQQAVAAKLMLRRRAIPCSVRFGVAIGGGGGDDLRAHAWVEAGQVPICGFPVDPDFVEVARFD